MTSPDLTEALDALIDEAESRGAAAAAVDKLRQRLAEPLRVAIAGRVKAGKSTLLNGLVGERLAATDAGHCTRIVTWYGKGAGYDVTAELPDGTSRPLSFDRADERLEIKLDGLEAEDIDRIVVGWPSQRLDHFTLIDTPGIGSEVGDVATSVDAVIYLLRHMHAGDAAFLETFTDRSVGTPSPVTALGVLSRADEIGSGRLDALDSARVVAQRYASDFRIQALVADVVPVAGLLAETGSTLREAEFTDLRDIAALDEQVRYALMRSVDRFWSLDVEQVPAERRRALVGRLGLFGVRFAVDAIVEGRVNSSSDLSDSLIEVSGIGRLVDALDHWFGRRATVLKARSVLADVRRLADDLGQHDSVAGRELAGSAERVEAGAIEFANIRLEQLVRSGLADLSTEEAGEITALTAGSPEDEPDTAAFETADGSPEELLERIEHWRARGTHPLNTPVTSEACELAARVYEHRIAALRLG